jgi:hypothetical protein
MMQEQAPRRAAYAVTREPGGPALAGWIELASPCAGQGEALVGEFLRIVAAAESGAVPEGTPALVIHPSGDLPGVLPRPGPGGRASRLEGLGRHLLTPVAVSSQMTVRPGGGAARARRVSLLAAAPARQSGFTWQLRRGPAVLCAVDGNGAGLDVTASQLVWLLTRQLILPRGHRCPPARAARGQVPGGF